MKKAILTGILFAMCGSAAVADETKGAPAFRDLDTDKDGFINSKEATAWSDLSAVFEHIDMNEDGKLDSTEYAALQANVTE
ncbi:MAG: EF-hand domain-containing protein [Gammaproteobacteria bacterium]|nr:EF-hand domain-containing protein [Gammaproteobacteria bacterium]